MSNSRVLQMLLMAMMLTSISMLAISINHYYLLPVAFVVTAGAFWFTDVLEWISFEGWIANTLSLGILIWSMYEFYPSDSAGKLIAVGKLLVCLQGVLVFQKKSPRLVWQIMVLSLLQVVITTIFSIHFEGSVLFVVFIFLSAVTLVLQNQFANEYRIEQRNETSVESRRQIEGDDSFSTRLAFWRFDCRPQPTVSSLGQLKKFSVVSLALLPGVAVIASMFTLFVFLTAPRQVDPWFSPISYKVAAAAITKTVDLEETGVIKNTDRKIFEAAFYPMDSDSDEGVQLNEAPYFRGIALSNLTFKDGKTNWNAAFERVNSRTYQPVRNLQRFSNLRYARMRVTMEKTTESLLYSLMPPGLSGNTSSEIKFCHEISAITRCRENEEINFAPYEYELMVPLTLKNVPGKAWPYVSNTINILNDPMSEDPAQQRWLTRMDRENYPTLVAIADRIAEEVRDSGGGRLELVKAFEDHFLNPSNYSYTLDYKEVDRNLSIDPNEDFVSNFKTGHCSAFASAMTLMLRSQGIPARMVVGFHGGEFNQRDQSYTVRAWHAHSWVEVYMRKRDCRLGNLEKWQYNDGGAWLIGDPTPPQPEIDEGLQAENAIDLARTVWQDYVLGIETDAATGDDSNFGDSFLATLSAFNMRKFSEQFEQSRNYGWLSVVQPLLFIVVILTGIIGILRMLILNAGYEEEEPDTAVGKIKRFFADAIGLISVGLREWVIGYDSETVFYKKLTDILEKQDLVREPVQTHLEFADEISLKYSAHPSSDLISSVVKEVTDAFNRVRFGLEELNDQERDVLDQRLVELESALGVQVS